MLYSDYHKLLSNDNSVVTFITYLLNITFHPRPRPCIYTHYSHPVRNYHSASKIAVDNFFRTLPKRHGAPSFCPGFTPPLSPALMFVLFSLLTDAVNCGNIAISYHTYVVSLWLILHSVISLPPFYRSSLHRCPHLKLIFVIYFEQIYIVGGFNGQEVLSSAEVFDPDTKQWSFIRSMLSPRSGVSLIAYRDCLYALGGFNGYSRLNTGQ